MSIEKKEFTIKDESAFRLRIRHWKAKSPSNLNSIEFIQECMRDGKVDFASSYDFLMTDDEVKSLVKGLESIVA